MAIGEAVLELKEINGVITELKSIDNDLKNILDGVDKTLKDLLWQSAGFMVEVLQSAINFLVKAFTTFIQNLLSLGNTVLEAIKRHNQADKEGADKLKSVIGSR